MKYMLMMSGTVSGGKLKGIMTWPKERIQAHIQHMMDLNGKLKSRGELVTAEGLDFPDKAKLVRADANGLPVTDGIFAETKEFLAGFWIVQVPSAERAYEIAAEASTAPGADGKPLNMAIEVRQVMQGPPEL